MSLWAWCPFYTHIACWQQLAWLTILLAHLQFQFQIRTAQYICCLKPLGNYSVTAGIANSTTTPVAAVMTILSTMSHHPDPLKKSGTMRRELAAWTVQSRQFSTSLWLAWTVQSHQFSTSYSWPGQIQSRQFSTSLWLAWTVQSHQFSTSLWLAWTVQSQH